MKKEQTSSLDETIVELRKKYGEGVVLTEETTPGKVETLPTGSFRLDSILGSGIPVGRIIEVFGETSGGKSTLSLFFAGQLQKQGKRIVYLDAEQAFDAVYAEKLGVDVKKLIISQTSSLEECFDVLIAFAKTGEIDMVIVDSVASLVPMSELEDGAIFKETIAVQARLLSRSLRIITGILAKSKTTVIFINQTRTNLAQTWGNKEISSGGKALKFYSSIRLSVAKGEKILGHGEEQIGAKLKVVAVKNKVAFPFRGCTIDLYFGSGIDLVSDAFDAALDAGLIIKTGNTYESAWASPGEVIKPKKLGVGRDQSLQALKDDEPLYLKVREELQSLTLKSQNG